MSLEKRIRRLEGEAGKAGTDRCSECGGPPKPGEHVEYEVVWENTLEPSDPNYLGPDYCPECGRQLVFTVTWCD